jgi:hypothetical protein
MELIKDVLDWIATNTGELLANLWPYAMLGLLGLYLLWLIVGYLRVSQISVAERRPGGQAVALPASAGADERPRGVPYCPVDGLQFPLGARFCTKCERDLILECGNCGATLSAGDASCYRCGTRTGAADVALLS